MQVARGFFRANGGCGYVPKPRHLLGGSRSDLGGSTEISADPPMVSVTRISLLCATWLPKPGEERAMPEPWIQSHSPLAKPMAPSDAPIISPLVTIEVRAAVSCLRS